MRGIVIAGGFGTRLRPLTLTRPKPLMPLVNCPLLEYQLSYLHAAGIEEVCFATNYLSEAVQAHFGDGAGMGMKISYAIEEHPLDTGGAIRNAYEAIRGDDCVVFNGDVIHAFDIKEIIEQHYRRGAEITLTLREVERPHAYGVVPINSHRHVTGFLEPTDEHKRAAAGPKTGEFDTINAGLYVMSARAIEAIPLRKCNVEREAFPKFVAEGWKVFADVRNDYWIDIGKPSQYLEAVSAIIEHRVTSPRPFLKRGDAAVDETAEVDDNAKLCCQSSIGPGCRIEARVEVCASALLENVRVMAGTSLINSIIGENSVIGPNCRIRESVIAAGSVIGEHTLLGSYA